MPTELGASLLAALGTLRGAPLQNGRLVHLHTPLGHNVLVAETLDAAEGVLPAHDHAGFVFELTALSVRADLSLKRLMGQPALLELLTDDRSLKRRALHGYMTDASLIGSDGSLARYRLRIEPWLRFAGYGRDSRSFHDLTVPQVVDAVLSRYRQHGALRAQWRWALADAKAYPPRSLVTQYQESDRAFVERLLLEEGLFAWFEHEGAAGEPSLGQHTLVIADHNGALSAAQGAAVRFTQSGAAFKADSLTQWQWAREVHTHAVSVASWDYRSVDLRPVQADAGPAGAGVPVLAHADVPSVYAYADTAQGQRLALRMTEQRHAAAQLHRARGAWRRAATGSVFSLVDHPTHNGRYTILGTRLQARNPLPADAQAEVLQRLGRSTAWHALEDPSLFQMSLTALAADLPVRSVALDAAGSPQLEEGWGLHRCPHVQGVQTAIVVSDGEPVLGDRDHRVKVQFHWQRDDNAPANSASGTWVRVAESLAGANWGSVFMPRAGQEVVVAFLDGHIDRPVIVGAVYNGKGHAEAQGNRLGGGVAGCSGNAPAWFPGSQAQGELQGHQHDATLIGFKSQALGASMSGQGDHNQLVFETHPGQARVELGTTALATRLQLGHLLHQSENQRLQPRGHGADLATQGSGALRAGAGLLLSARSHGGSVSGAAHQLDTSATQATLLSGTQLQQALAQAAHTHEAKTAAEVTPSEGPAAKALTDSKTAWAATDTRGAEAAPATGPNGTEAPRIDGGLGTVPAWSRPDLLLEAQSGLALHTPRHALFSAGATWSLTTSADLNLAAQRSVTVAVKDGVVWFTQGEAPKEARPVTHTGIQLHAASGSVSVQAQSGARAKAEVRAAKAVDVNSTTAHVSLAAPKHLMLNAAGTAIELKGGNITLTTSGGAMFKAAMKRLDGPGGASESLALPKAKDLYHERFQVTDEESGQVMPFFKYRIENALGEVLGRGQANAEGWTTRIHSAQPEEIRIVRDDV